MSKETFKAFARLHPELAKSVLNKTVSWQQLYEIYEIYGENNSIWNNYLNTNIISSTQTATSLKEILNTFKNLDMDSVQQGITNIQKTISLLQDIGIGNKVNTYERRPIYKRFED